MKEPHGYIKCDLSKGIIRPFCIKTYDPPYLSVSDQKRLDNYIRLNESWRNRAIILLALNLGLRKSDIVKLSLQDIDFKHKTLYIIQRKTGNPLRVPINDVIDVIKNYINLERPRPCINRTEPIFLTTVPPFKPLTNVHCITSGVLKRAGIKAKNGNARGPHLLRYSLVHAMMKVGTNHKIITDTLGHVSEDSDRPYLSMDLEMLRQCALDLSMIGKGRGFE